MDCILFPMRPEEGKDAIPRVSRLYVKTEEGVEATGLQVIGRNYRDIFLMCEDGANVMETDELKFSGELLWMRLPQR